MKIKNGASGGPDSEGREWRSQAAAGTAVKVGRSGSLVCPAVPEGASRQPHHQGKAP
jgi:hypothetical protein